MASALSRSAIVLTAIMDVAPLIRGVFIDYAVWVLDAEAHVRLFELGYGKGAKPLPPCPRTLPRIFFVLLAPNQVVNTFRDFKS